eukprot:CAMPEP_0114691222 /NCGR_PEP_ID=MMETSP0191-20121206/66598_1 /TAXON_ID=126664 /ORGANISM="Sorites sp." /LENGTH=116 /DNA_ID=CAMNT_0001982161 /DNA_START=266 /DNA_END=616 /DNA_ORIENTATION=-
MQLDMQGVQGDAVPVGLGHRAWRVLWAPMDSIFHKVGRSFDPTLLAGRGRFATLDEVSRGHARHAHVQRVAWTIQAHEDCFGVIRVGFGQPLVSLKELGGASPGESGGWVSNLQLR